MPALKYFLLSLILCFRLTVLAQPGSYYPPPANVDYHNDTLTIFPPDSLPGEPVVLIGYNIYVDSVFFNNVPAADPSETIDYIFSFPALPPGDHEFCAYAVYNQWISEPACDSALVIYGYELPFLEDWSSGNFEELQWIPSSGNWVISNEEGNPVPSVEFRRDPVQTDYSLSLESYPINASGMTQGKIWLDFNLKLDDSQPTGNEMLKVQVWNSDNRVWTTVAQYRNDDGSFTWFSEYINIKAYAMNKVFRVRFQASGLNSADIQGWYIDNIHIYRSCDGPYDLELEEHWNYNELSWIPPTGCWYDPWIRWDDGVNSGNSIGTGGAVEFDVAARWTPAQLTYYQGLPISQVAFFPAEYAATYNVRIWVGEGPDSMVVDQEVPNPVIGQWNYVTLTPTVPLDVTKELWVGYHVTAQTGYPAGVDDGPAINGYGNMMNFGGWQTLLQINPYLDYNWNIACMLGPDPDDPELYFNIYRKTINEEFQFYESIKDVVYLDTNIILADVYCYKVTLVWENNGDTCESDPTNTVCETINVGTSQQETGQSIKIYPNPAKDWLNIEADEEIREVRIYNLLGESVLKMEIGNLDYRLDISFLQDGIYYAIVETGKSDFKAKIVILR